MESLTNNKVLITGINGFTGIHLESFLRKKGFQVYGTVTSKPTSKNHFQCNLLDEKSIESVLAKINPDYIIHLAAISFVASSDQLKIYEVNVFGTLNLLKSLEKVKCNPKKIIIASSAVVYGNKEGEIGEEMTPEPVNHYGNSKLAMENMVKTYFDKQNIIITRPFNYTGSGQKEHFLIPKIVSHFIKKEKTIQLGNIDVYREFNDVNFISECYFKLINSREKSIIVNVCTGKELNIREILTAMETISNHKIKVEVNPEFIRKNEIKVLKGSPKKLNTIIGEEGENYNIKRTLQAMYINE